MTPFVEAAVGAGGAIIILLAARILWTGPWHIELASALVGLAVAFLVGTAHQIKGPVRNMALLAGIAWAITSSVHSVLRGL